MLANEELVAKAMYEAPDAYDEPWSYAEPLARELYLRRGRVAIEALTTAGRLIPEGARVREERCFDPYKNAFLWRTVIETPWGKREVQGDESEIDERVDDCAACDRPLLGCSRGANCCADCTHVENFPAMTNNETKEA